MPLHQGHREEHDGLALGKHFVLTPCFIETQRGTVICPKSHSQPQADRPGTRTRACDSDALFTSHRVNLGDIMYQDTQNSTYASRRVRHISPKFTDTFTGGIYKN